MDSFPEILKSFFMTLNLRVFTVHANVYLRVVSNYARFSKIENIFTMGYNATIQTIIHNIDAFVITNARRDA